MAPRAGRGPPHLARRRQLSLDPRRSGAAEGLRSESKRVEAPTTLLLRKRRNIPLHHQVFLVLQDRIAERRYAPGEALPSEEDLAKLFGVSRVTIRAALETLNTLGLIASSRCRYVCARARQAGVLERADHGSRGPKSHDRAHDHGSCR